MGTPMTLTPSPPFKDPVPDAVLASKFEACPIWPLYPLQAIMTLGTSYYPVRSIPRPPSQPSHQYHPFLLPQPPTNSVLPGVRWPGAYGQEASPMQKLSKAHLRGLAPEAVSGGANGHMNKAGGPSPYCWGPCPLGSQPTLFPTLGKLRLQGMTGPGSA